MILLFLLLYCLLMTNSYLASVVVGFSHSEKQFTLLMMGVSFIIAFFLTILLKIFDYSKS